MKSSTWKFLIPALAMGALLMVGCTPGGGKPASTASATTASTEKIALEASHAEKAALPEPGPQVPDFTLTGIDGKSFTLSSERGKHPVLVNFFATWCEGCNEEYPHLEQLYEKYKDEGLRVVSISNEPPDTLLPFAKKMGARFTVLTDPNGVVSNTYQVDSIPASVLVDTKGRGITAMVGYSEDGFQDQIAKYVPALLKQSIASR
jgi:peroxiredoxin